MPRRPMGATCLTLPSCPPTWARSVVLTNSACRSWVNGSSPVVRCWPAGSSRPTSSPGGVAAADARLRRATADPAAGARAAGVAPDDVADHDPPLSLHRLRACVTPRHQPGRRAAGEAVASRAAMGARRHRVSALDRRSGRRGPRRVVEHRERRGAGRGQACVDRGPTPVRRCARDRRRRALLAPHPPRR